MTRFSMVLFILFTFLFITPVSAEDHMQVMEKEDIGLQWEYYREGGMPQGLITNSNPYITYYISVNAAQGESYLLKMFLNDEEVEASYNPITNQLTYQAGELTGDNRVRVELHSGGKIKEWSWSFSIDDAPVEPLNGADREALTSIQEEAVTTINEYRSALSLPLFTSNMKLQQIAQAHSNYLMEHSEDGHTERNPESEWFTGYQIGDRAKYFNYSGFIGEGIAFQEARSEGAIRRLFDAPYHRLSLIDPRFSEIGTGYNDSGDFVANYGGSGVIQSPETVLYPYDNQENVKLSWYAFEVPNPLRFYDKDAVWTGYPISFGYFGSPQDELQVEEATLTDSKGKKVDIYEVLPSMEEEGNKTHAFLIPKEPLTPGMTYHVDIKADVHYSKTESVDVSKAWSFTTADSLDISSVYFEEQNGTTFLKEEWASGVDPDAEMVLSKENETFIKKQGDSHQRIRPLETGHYELEVTSPLFQETKTYDLTIRNDQNRSYKYESPWTVTDFAEREVSTGKAVWGGYTDWTPSGKVASANKEWTIVFNQSMTQTENLENYMYVIDATGEKVPVSVRWKSEEQKEAIISPDGSYAEGEYLLVIEPMEGTSKKVMEDGVRMAFTVR